MREGPARFRVAAGTRDAVEDLAANFCQGCGSVLAGPRPCGRCGELIDPDARFCDNCGMRIA